MADVSCTCSFVCGSSGLKEGAAAAVVGDNAATVEGAVADMAGAGLPSRYPAPANDFTVRLGGT